MNDLLMTCPPAHQRAPSFASGALDSALPTFSPATSTTSPGLTAPSSAPSAKPRAPELLKKRSSASVSPPTASDVSSGNEGVESADGARGRLREACRAKKRSRKQESSSPEARDIVLYNNVFKQPGERVPRSLVEAAFKATRDVGGAPKFEPALFSRYDLKDASKPGKTRDYQIVRLRFPPDDVPTLESAVSGTREYIVEAPVPFACSGAWLCCAWDVSGQCVVIDDGLKPANIRGCRVAYPGREESGDIVCTALPAAEIISGRVATFSLRLHFKQEKPKKTRFRFVLIAREKNGGLQLLISDAFAVGTDSALSKKHRNDALCLDLGGPEFYDEARGQRRGSVSSSPASPAGSAFSSEQASPDLGPLPLPLSAAAALGAAAAPAPPACACGQFASPLAQGICILRHLQLGSRGVGPLTPEMAHALLEALAAARPAPSPNGGGFSAPPPAAGYGSAPPVTGFGPAPPAAGDAPPAAALPPSAQSGGGLPAPPAGAGPPAPPAAAFHSAAAEERLEEEDGGGLAPFSDFTPQHLEDAEPTGLDLDLDSYLQWDGDTAGDTMTQAL
eukprot:tig00020563_g11272.t1